LRVQSPIAKSQRKSPKNGILPGETVWGHERRVANVRSRLGGGKARLEENRGKNRFPRDRPSCRAGALSFLQLLQAGGPIEKHAAGKSGITHPRSSASLGGRPAPRSRALPCEAMSSTSGCCPLDHLDEGSQTVIDTHEVERLVARELLGQSRRPLGGRNPVERPQSFSRTCACSSASNCKNAILGAPMESIVVNVHHHSPSGSPGEPRPIPLFGRVCRCLLTLYPGGNKHSSLLPARGWVHLYISELEERGSGRRHKTAPRQATSIATSSERLRRKRASRLLNGLYHTLMNFDDQNR